MMQVPDAASIATMRLVRELTGRNIGGSTGTNVWGALTLAAEMLARGQQGSIVTLICDGGERYGAHLLRRRLGARPADGPRALLSGVARVQDVRNF